jgi:hypothetical protein
MHEYLSKLEKLNLDENTIVVLSYSDGAEVFHYKDDGGIEDAIEATDTIRRFSELVGSLQESYEGVHPIVEALDNSYAINLEDFREETDDALAEPTYNIDWSDIHDGIINNFYDQEYIESEVKRYDHKRGYCTLTATVEITLAELFKVRPDLSGWYIEIETDDGTTTIDA